jgi:hypothetical protein
MSPRGCCPLQERCGSPPPAVARRVECYLAARAGFAGHILWYQMDPSLTWLPFFRIRSLHLGQVPMTLSFDD